MDDIDDPAVRRYYDRNSPQYPYKSHGQWLRACYAFWGCLLFILFNGWRTFVSPMHVADFVACYIPVSFEYDQHFGGLEIADTYWQILLFSVISICYQIKLNGWNPLCWRRRATRELQNPRPQIATSSPRRGHISLKNKDNLFTVSNFRQFCKWIWVWLQ